MTPKNTNGQFAPCHKPQSVMVVSRLRYRCQRLPRLRAHIQLKGAELPFEDEKFSYVVLTREPLTKRFNRVLAEPAVGKVEVSAKLCTANGLQLAKVPRRDKAAYAKARRWRWGEAVVDQS